MAGPDTAVPTVLLRTDPNVMHHGALGVVRSLGARGVAVHATVEHAWTPMARSRHLHRRWPWAVGTEAVLDGLDRIADALDRPAVLLTTDDGGAMLLAEHGERLRDRFLFPRVPAELPRRLADKAALPGLCAEHGMPCPRTEPAADPARVRAFAASTGLPVVVKRPAAWERTGPGRPSTSLVRTPAELDALLEEVAARPGSLLLQEYLAPLMAADGAQDWFVHAYLDGAGRAVFAGTGVKERSYPAHAGLTSLGRVEPWPALAEITTGFLRRAGYRGIVDLDLRVDPADGTAKLLDANPRPGAQFRMFRGAGGTDVVVAAHLDLTGRRVPHDPPTPRRFLVEPYDPLSALTHARRGELGARAWAASVRRVDEPAWFAADDPLPFALMAARTTVTALGRAARHQLPSTPIAPAEPRKESTMSQRTDVVVIGAGPYGLSLGAHLAATGLRVRQFGRVMQAWKTMPKGMYLKSQGFASSLSDPRGTHRLQAYCARTETPYADYGLPVALDTFVAYGEWFAREQVPDVEEVPVVGLTTDTGGFRVELGDGEVVRAARVVVAVGITGAAAMPPELADLPTRLASHSSDHTDLADFSGRRVVVLGAGQSALESAALLHESGADVRIVARARRVAWNGDPLAAQRSVWRRLREPEAPLGSGWGTWFYSNQPDLYRRLPAGTRLSRARSALGPAGAYWLRPRVEGVVPTLTGHRVEAADTGDDDEVRLDLRDAAGRRQVLHADHVLAGTGYRIDLSRIGFLDPSLIARIDTLGGTPAVTAEYHSSVPGLYFCGPAVAPSLGPVMRFAYGSAHAAAACTRGLRASLPTPVAARG